jgi:acyl carrier protein
MDINKFIAHFAEQFDDTPMDAFQADTKFREIEEWDSLSALSVIAMIDEEYEIQITGADIRSISTIKELFDLVSAKS